MSKRTIYLIVTLVALLAVFFLTLFIKKGGIKFNLKVIKNNSVLTILPTPTPFPPEPYPLAQGKQVYGISRGEGSKGPDLREVTIDPFDPKKNEKQTMTVKINKTEKLTKSVIIILKTDNSEKSNPLSLRSTDQTNEVWEGSWTLEDTNNVKYQVVIDAKDEIEISHVELSFR